MVNLLLVAIGGALGSVARYAMGEAAARLFGLTFPLGTLAVNVLGSLAIGVLAARVGPDQDQLRLALGVGFLGGFTTFSTFSLESVRLLQDHIGSAALYIAASLVFSIAACWLGLWLGRV